jgi:carboxymethylenebutenolidase
MNQRLIDLYDEYTHGSLDRRVFLARLAQLAGGAAAAVALVPMLQANQARAALVPPNDPRLETDRSSILGPRAPSRRISRAPKAARNSRP